MGSFDYFYFNSDADIRGRNVGPQLKLRELHSYELLRGLRSLKGSETLSIAAENCRALENDRERFCLGRLGPRARRKNQGQYPERGFGACLGQHFSIAIWDGNSLRLRRYASA